MSSIESMVTTDPLNAKNRTHADPGEITSDVFLHAKFVNTYALKTEEGLVLIDPGLTSRSKSVYEYVKDWVNAPLHTAIYTHGHADHAFGLAEFIAAGESPNIVAQENCPPRFRRYQLTHGWNANINKRQFSLKKPAFPKEFHWPTEIFSNALTQHIGELTLELRAAKGETDDHCYIWVPEKKYLFTGDLVIWVAPNCGNPQKVQRYPMEWAQALDEMAALGAEWLFPGHGLVIKGREAVKKVLTETAQYLRVIISQVLERMNRGETPEDIFHAVEPDPELASRPYLQSVYDHPKFIVRNLLRLWGGWWNGNAADLLPATWAQQGAEIADLAGGIDALVYRGHKLLEQGNSVLAAHVAEWATRSEPSNDDAQRLKRDVYAKRLEEEDSLMVQGIYRAAMNDARGFLGQEQASQTRRGFLTNEDLND